MSSVIDTRLPQTPKVYRRITSNAFWERVGEDLEDILRVMAINALAAKDTKLSNQLRKIDNGEYVGLDNPKLVEAFDNLRAVPEVAALLDQTKFDEIFANAIIDEVPEAQK